MQWFPCTLTKRLSPPLLLASLLAAFTSGCVGWDSSALPPRLSTAEKEHLNHAHLPLTVGIDGSVEPPLSEELYDVLQRTKLFDRVDYLGNFSAPPSLVARVEGSIPGTPTIPVWPLLTFGIIPTTVREDAGMFFSLCPPGKPEQRVFIKYIYSNSITMGWVALFDVFHPDRTASLSPPTHSGRFADRIGLMILDHEDTLRH